ncbi:tetratricopeptide repeat protein [Streptomyces roseolus]|uniref:tetratricopeptide repeat protein n=1 Tax=Streptomyces roseolus TaxID=67358 RepID=UPI00167B5100|nr:tetratricopeptide repeat protein [Streptomyces roseolus]GGR28327.1 hypothetical protein GCM10010282_20890 [Streptomyces roseolus]
MAGAEQHATASGNARIYQALENVYVTETHPAPAPRSLGALPAARRLTGRDEPVSALLKALGPEGPAATVVTGSPGAGKTALAVRAAHQAVASGLFPGGVLFVHLRGYAPAGAATPEEALETLLRALGVRDADLPPTGEELAALYQSELARRAEEHGAVLIVADDASSPGQLRPLVPAHARHRLLSTSRDALAAPGLGARLVPLAELDAESATELIAAALADVRPDDPRAGTSPRALRQVADYCGRLPLALTVAAALLADDPGLPVDVLAGDLADARTRLAALEHEDADGHTLGVRAAIRLSHQRMKEREDRLFRLLPQDPGPDVSTEAAAALCDRTPRETRKSLAALTRAGLLAEQPVGSNRWRMHDLIRLYAAGLPPCPGTDEARERLLIHYGTACVEANAHLSARPPRSGTDAGAARFADRAAALKWLDAESRNLVALVFRVASLYPQASLITANALNLYLDRRHRFREMAEINAFAVTVAQALKDRRHEGRALNGLGNAYLNLRRYKESTDAHLRAMKIHGELGDTVAQNLTLMNVGNTLQLLGRHDEAIDVLTQVVALYRKGDHSHGEAAALNNLGAALLCRGRHEDAIAAFRRAATIHSANGDSHEEAQVRNNLGSALRRTHRHREAVAELTWAADTYREYGDFHREAETRDNLGHALLHTRRHEEAAAAHAWAAELFRRFGETARERRALAHAGRARQALRE